MSNMHLKPGSSLQGRRYIIEKVIGQGGFGITYRAEQAVFERKVAVKEFFMKDLCDRDASTSWVSVPSAGSRELVERFRRKFLKEARNIAKLNHPGIISVFDVFEENGTAYYVMEYLGGGSLACKVQGGALPEQQAVRYVCQVAEALSYLHDEKMMHLDVKPANILINKKDNAVLIDFGLAKQYDDTGSQTSTTPVGISHGYAPMEQYKRGGVSTFSPATDIYSLGATLYKLVTGQNPPEASDVHDDGLPALPPHISAPVARAIEAAMKSRRKERPQSIEAFLGLLKGVNLADGSTDYTNFDDPVVELFHDEEDQWISTKEFIKQSSLYIQEKYNISRRILVGFFRNKNDDDAVSSSMTNSLLFFKNPLWLKRGWYLLFLFVPVVNFVFLVIVTWKLLKFPFRLMKLDNFKNSVFAVEDNLNRFKIVRHNNGKYGLIRWTHCADFSYLLKAVYSSISDVGGGNVIVEKNSRYGLYNMQRKRWVLPCRYDSIAKAGEDFVIAKKGKKEIKAML